VYKKPPQEEKMHLDSYACALCSLNPEETCLHLFFTCAFSQSCWNWLLIDWDLDLPPHEMLTKARTDFGSHIFREIFITAAWMIWKVRNGVTFDNKAVSLTEWKILLKEELGLVCIKAKQRIADSLKVWCENRL